MHKRKTLLNIMLDNALLCTVDKLPTQIFFEEILAYN